LNEDVERSERIRRFAAAYVFALGLTGDDAASIRSEIQDKLEARELLDDANWSPASGVFSATRICVRAVCHRNRSMPPASSSTARTPSTATADRRAASSNLSFKVTTQPVSESRSRSRLRPETLT
jgi:hypothetical protein